MVSSLGLRKIAPMTPGSEILISKLPLGALPSGRREPSHSRAQAFKSILSATSRTSARAASSCFSDDCAMR
jgi:hypothetical protein